MSASGNHSAKSKSVLTEVTGVRFDQKAVDSLRDGERGFWMVLWDVSDVEVRASGVCLKADWEPTQLVIFRDSGGMVPKFVYGPREAAEALCAEFGGRIRD